MYLIAFMLLGLLPAEDCVVDSVDLVEWNSFYDERGRHVFDQLIFYDWNEKAGRHEIRAWRMRKSNAMNPVYDEPNREYVMTWFDSQSFCWRRVYANSYRRSHTIGDPELEERKTRPTEQRRDLIICTKKRRR